MKVYNLSVLCITLLTVFFSQVSEGVPRGKSFGRGLKFLGGYGGRGGLVRPLHVFPVPIIKKVTHHHIHHIISTKGLGKSKLGESGQAFDGGYKGGNDYAKGENSYTKVNKRGGRFGGVIGDDLGGKDKEVDFNPLYSENNGYRSGIQGFIGDTKAHFVPIVIGIIDDNSKDSKDFSEQKGGGSHERDTNRGVAGFGLKFGNEGDCYDNFDNGKDFADGGYGGNREYSSRKGLLRTSNTKSEYIPPPETVKLFQELARHGW